MKHRGNFNLCTKHDNATEIKSKYDSFFKTSKIQHAKHDRYMEDSVIENLDVDGEILRVEKIEYSVCPECGHPIKILDTWRGETVCQNCGISSRVNITTMNDIKYSGRTFEPLPKNTDVTKEEWAVLCQIKAKRHMKFNVEENYLKPARRTDMKSWRESQYALTVGTYSSVLRMNKSQKERIIYILEHNPLKKIHSRLRRNTIIAGVCRYVLEQDGRGKELRYNREPFIWVSLTNKNYEVIKHNLDNLLK